MLDASHTSVNLAGDDANDFDNNAMALTAFEDTYLTIKDVDGAEWVRKWSCRGTCFVDSG